MRMILTAALTAVFVIGFLPSLAQNQDLALGDWRAHLPYQRGLQVTQSDNRVYFATDLSVLELDKTDLAARFLTKVDGLSRTGINQIKFQPGSDILIVVYDDSAIDLIYPNGKIVTMNQIPNFTNITGEKTINQVTIENDSLIYLAASFGVSRINTQRAEFVSTTFTPTRVRAVAAFQEDLYAATEEGIYRINRNNPNPENFGLWELLSQEQGFPAMVEANYMTTFANRLYLDVNDTLAYITEEGYQTVHFQPGFEMTYLSGEASRLLAGYRCNSEICSQGMVLNFDADGNRGQLDQSCAVIPQYAVEDDQGRIWLADRARDFRVAPDYESPCEELSFNAPYSAENREMIIYNNELWLAYGGVNQTFGYRFLDHGFSSLIDGQWTVFNRNNREELKGEDPSDPGDDLLDFITIAVHPVDERIFAGSFIEGLIEFDRENMILYNDSNSSLNNAVGDNTRTRVSGLSFDSQNNLWVSNHLADRPFSVLRSDGTWKSFRPDCRETLLHQVIVDDNDYLWFVNSGSSTGILVFDPGDIDNNTDDRCRNITSSNSNLPTNRANCLALDLDGDVWVGTESGIIIFECGNDPFTTTDCQGTLRIVEQDGFGAFLLETEVVRTIAVDGANRKWVGTENGIFVLSPEGEELIARFTEENTPLFDNSIIDIAINSESGEVFIGTEQGIISYKGDAVAGGRVHQSDIEIYPNPVRPDHQGPIAIRGLSRDAQVKITDISGKLIFETDALGGQAIWDGRDYNGRRASSGVYLVFSATRAQEGNFGAEPTSAVGKIIFLK